MCLFYSKAFKACILPSERPKGAKDEVQRPKAA